MHEARGLDVLPTTIRRFRAAGDAASAALLEGTVLPEEVTHCAAGVRWLRHLHGVAHAGDGCTLSSSKGPASAQPRGAPDMRTAAPREVSSPRSESTACVVPPLDKAAHPCQSSCACSDSLERCAASSRVGDANGWQQEARRCGSVQKWFHALVRAHFKGATKAPFNDEARAAAGFDESWYLPLTAGA